MSRKELGHGLRAVATRRRIKEQHVAANAAGAHSHVMAVEAHRDWLTRRIAEALTKVADKPNAKRGLEKLQAHAERGLSNRERVFLQVIENRLAKGEDIEDMAPRNRPILPSKRPQWMFDTSLLPKKPPGAT